MIARHRTLHDLVAWSHDLLDPDEQRLFARLSVFAGSFGLDAAERVCGGRRLSSSRVLALLANLVDKSMVQLVDDGPLPRYRVLETLREFGRGQLGPKQTRRPRATGTRAGTSTSPSAARSALAGPDEADGRRGPRPRLRQPAFRARLVDRARRRRSRAAARRRAPRVRVPLHARRGHRLGRRGHRDPGGAEAPRALPGRRRRRGVRPVRPRRPRRCDRARRPGPRRRGAASASTARDSPNGRSATRGSTGAMPRTGTEWMERMIAVALATDRRPGSRTRSTCGRSPTRASVNMSKGAQLAGEARAAAAACGSPTAHAQASYALGLALESTDPIEAAEHLVSVGRRRPRAPGTVGSRRSR